MDFSRPSVPEFFRGRDVFVTGGTGFVGKVLIEKLLRSCPDINRLFMLCRPKKGRTVEERKLAFSKPPLFDVIRVQNPQWLDKVHIIQGDVSELRLGISPDDIKLLANVSVIFHVAASVRFDDPLKQSILLNTRGTHEIIKLALDMKHLVSFVHTSTTYFSHNHVELEETTYKLDYDWRTAIKAAEMFDDTTMNALTALYTNNSPNTYTFAKGLAEQVCMDYADQLPMTIYRPSVITSSEQEPIEVWTDSFNGPVGLFLACGYGVMRTIFCKPECELNCCPVDLCVKGMIISAWKKPIVDVPSSEVAVYNCASIRVVTYSLAISQAKEHTSTIPFHDIMWAPGGVLTTSKLENYLRTIFFQVLPAILVDCILRLKGQAPRVLKLQRKIYCATNAVSFFVFHKYNFHNDRYSKLDSFLDGDDRATFSLDTKRETAIEYFFRSTLGWRRYLMHHGDELIPGDKIRLKKMMLLHNTLQYSMYALLAFMAYRIVVPWYQQLQIFGDEGIFASVLNDV